MADQETLLLKLKGEIENCLIKFPDKDLEDLGKEDKRKIEETLKWTKEYGFGDIKLTPSVKATGEIEVFNSRKQKDEDEILGLTPKKDLDKEMKIAPQIIFDKEHAWVKYRASLEAEVSGEVDISNVEGSAGPELDIVFIDYHVHDKEENTRSAVKQGITNLRLPIIPRHIMVLNPKEAVAYKVRGAIKTELKLDLTDLFTGNTSKLLKFLKDGELLKIELKAGPYIGFKVKAEDDFALVFSCPEEDTIRVALKKCVSTEDTIFAGFNVGIEFADEKEAEEILLKNLKLISGKTLEEIHGLLEKDPDQLNEDEKKEWGKIKEKLKSKDETEVKDEELPTILKDIKEEIKKIAKYKVKLGFKYEYLRIHQESNLIQATIKKTDLKDEYHKALMAYDLTPILAESTPFELERHLNQDTVIRKKSWGFSLGIGPWEMASHDSIKKTIIQQKNLIDPENPTYRFAFNGMREYNEEWINQEVKWLVDFKADMEDFSEQKIPQTKEFDFGLHFLWQWEEAQFSRSEIMTYLDHAMIWEAIDQDDVDEILEDIKEELDNDEKGTLKIEFKLENGIFRELLPKIKDFDLKQLAIAHAKAMPWLKREGREKLADRVRLYTPLWEYYFNNYRDLIGNYVEMAGSTLRKMRGGREIANFEIRRSNNKPAYFRFLTFAGQIYHNSLNNPARNYSKTYFRWKKFQEGISLLNGALNENSDADYKIIIKAFDKMRKIWNQRLHVRAAGAYLVDLALKNYEKENNGQIERTLTIEFPGKKKTLIYSGGEKI